MSTASPPMALLALHGYSGTQIARASGRSLTNISHLLTGRLRWNTDVEKTILEVTNGKQAAALDFVRRVILAYVTGNDDLHLKNISVQRLPDSTSPLCFSSCSAITAKGAIVHN